MPFWEERTGLDGRTAIVLGGGEGIGAAVTLALAHAGVEVSVCDVKADALEQTAAEVERRGRLRRSRVVDVGDFDALAAFLGDCGQESDPLDILVNVAGGSFRKPFLEQTAEDWEMHIRWNWLYVVEAVRLAVPRIRAGGRGGSIVSFTTIEAHRAVPRHSMYGGAKAALASFTRSLALELGPEGIRLNTIAVDVTMTPGYFRNKQPYDRQEELEQRRAEMYVPLGRFGTPEDMANAVLFLASDLSSGITGTALHVDGGTFASSGWTNWPEGPAGSPRRCRPTCTGSSRPPSSHGGSRNATGPRA